MAQQCAYTCERRAKGKRYVFARWRCRNTTTHPSGYCHLHRFAVNKYMGRPP